MSVKSEAMLMRLCFVAALANGCSIRATVRTTGVAENRIAKLLDDLGTVGADYHDGTFAM